MGRRQKIERLRVLVKILPGAESLGPPRYMTAGAACADLLAAVSDTVVIPPGGIMCIPLGFEIALPHGYEAQIRPRSGLALKHMVTVLNSPGTIDSDYRGAVSVILINHGKSAFAVNRGDRVAQMVISPVLMARFEEIQSLPVSERGSGGFGSSGRE